MRFGDLSGDEEAQAETRRPLAVRIDGIVTLHHG
jgi:hypothetical protein